MLVVTNGIFCVCVFVVLSLEVLTTLRSCLPVSFWWKCKFERVKKLLSSLRQSNSDDDEMSLRCEKHCFLFDRDFCERCDFPFSGIFSCCQIQEANSEEEIKHGAYRVRLVLQDPINEKF